MWSLRHGKRSVGRLFCALSVVVTLFAATSCSTVRAGGQTNPPALWLEMSRSPTDLELSFAATHYRVVVFNLWDTAALHKLKRLNPKIKVLAYQDLASTRSGATWGGRDNPVIPAGVGYIEAMKGHTSWFATNAFGQRIQWAGYPGQWQMAVWNADYQNRWVANVTARITQAGFDGVFADNAMYTLDYYYSGRLSGGKTDADIRTGLQQLVAKAGAALDKRGKILVPNISESRLQAGRWFTLALWGGGFEEMFLHWSNDPNSGFVSDTPDQGWSSQVSQMSGPGVTLARTNAEPNDDRSYRFGLASFWIGGGGTYGAFTATGHDAYNGLAWRPEQAWDFGRPTTGIITVGAVRYRLFLHGYAVANPSNRTVTISVPGGFIDKYGHSVHSLRLGPLSGQVLRRG
jgi:hypothetical protein